jgi:Predicted nucleotide-binding protein containing TIR-like domain
MTPKTPGKAKYPAKKAAMKKRAAVSVAEKRTYYKQSDFPQASLEHAQKIPSVIVENFADGGSPPDIALALGISPTSSQWPALAGASIAYGLTEGGVNASTMKITALGRRLVAPEEEGEDVTARREAILKPRVQREFFEKYRRAKLPTDLIAANVLKSMSLPADRVQSALEIIKANGRYAGFIRDIPTGSFVSLDSPSIPSPTATTEFSELHAVPVSTPNGRTEGAFPFSEPSSFEVVKSSPHVFDPKTDRVFITHGKQKSIVTQLKELLTFGKFEPVVSVERESTAIPVPEKVFEDMRSCGAGVIHVGAEGKYLDKDGNEHAKLNDNVLIEIGAAMALYGKKVILLVEEGVALPSNLQGLYRCEFTGDRLEYEATMKLLKTFSQFH